MRVLHITRDYPPYHKGGLSTAVSGLVSGLEKRGVRNDIVSFDGFRPAAKGSGKRDPDCQEHGAAQRIIRVSGVDELSKAQALAVETMPDIIHVHHEMLWEFSELVSRQNSAPMVYSAHILQHEQNSLRGIADTQSSKAQVRALSSCHMIHAPSQFVADSISALQIPDSPGVEVVGLGKSMAGDFSVEGFDGQSLTRAHVLYVGRFSDVNGFSEFLEALLVLLDEYPEMQVTIAGGLPGNTKGERRWHRRWQEMGSAHLNRVNWTGWISQDELSSLYTKANFLVIPSWIETFGQVALEGMQHGIALICTKVGALTELVDESCAQMIEAQSVEAIIEGVRESIREGAKTKRRRMRALEIANQGYGWDKQSQAFVLMYKKLLAES